jgi:hypothetical protein
MSVGSRTALIAFVWLGAMVPAYAGERDQLNACREMVDRAAQSQKSGPAVEADPELQRCRQIIKEWTLRDARRSVDEHGQPLRQGGMR